MIQIVVYSGAILILFVFVIALLSSGDEPFDVGPNRMPRVLVPAVALAAWDWVVCCSSSSSRSGPRSRSRRRRRQPAMPASSARSPISAHALFTTNLLPFEVTAFVLMVAVIGVVLLAGDVDPPRVRAARRCASASVNGF